MTIKGICKYAFSTKVDLLIAQNLKYCSPVTIKSSLIVDLKMLLSYNVEDDRIINKNRNLNQM